MNRLMQNSLFQLTLMRLRLFFREPEAVFWIFAFPILLSVGLSIAFRNRPADVLHIAGSTPQITQALNADKGLSAITIDEDHGRNALATGKIVLLAVQQRGGIKYEYDDTNPDARMARIIADRAIQKAAGQRESVESSNEFTHDLGARYIDFVVPGLLGMNLMSSAIWALGFSIVEARQKRLLKRLVASPMPRWQFLASFILSRLVLLAMEVGVFLGFVHYVFEVPLRGPLWQLGSLCMLVSLTFSAVGLLLASRASTMQAVSGLMNLTMLPMWILSGVFFSSSRFPSVVQPLIHALPLTAAIDILRSNMLEGTPIMHMGLPITILSTWLICAFALSLRVFRWR